MRPFRSLKVWEKAHDLTLAVYRATGALPREEKYGLSSQIRRAAVSIPSNIAEGCGRDTDADFARFLQIAMGSASEVEYQLLLCRELGYLPEKAHGVLDEQTQEVKRMLVGLSSRLKAGS